MENNLEEWQELRARVDSIASAVFLVAGGALSLSITVVIGNLKELSLSDTNIAILKWAWGLLVVSIVLTLSVKISSVLQKYILLIWPDVMDRHYMKFNNAEWALGLTAFLLFCIGLSLLAFFGSQIISASQHSIT